MDAGGGEPVRLSVAESGNTNPILLRDGRLLYTQGVGLSGASVAPITVVLNWKSDLGPQGKP